MLNSVSDGLHTSPFTRRQNHSFHKFVMNFAKSTSTYLKFPKIFEKQHEQDLANLLVLFGYDWAY
jgi:hypothetical protein